jgi:hypothetical protein
MQHQHIADVDPDDCWQSGILGFFLRYRGIATASGTKILLASMAIVYKNKEIAIVLAVATIISILLLLKSRRSFLNDRSADKQLHALFHELRDEMPVLLSLINDPKNQAMKFDEINQKSAQLIAAFFRSKLSDPNVNCAIRLAEDLAGGLHYVTKARSDGMDPSRKQSSEPIMADKGLAAALRSKDSKGVFLIPSIKSAVAGGIWEKNKTDEYSDVKTLIVAPINGIEAGTRVMMGILYVTSTTNVFQVHHTVLVKAFADALGMAYSVIEHQAVLKNSKRQSQTKKHSK